MLHRVRQLGALGREKLDTVIVIRIMGGGNDNASLQTQGPGQVGNGRGGHGTDQADIDACRGKTRLQGRFEHIARNSRVLADEHRRALAGFGMGPLVILGHQHLAGAVPQTHDEIGGNRRLPHSTAHAVGAEILSAHFYLPICLIRLGRARASQLATPPGHPAWQPRHAPARCARRAELP